MIDKNSLEGKDDIKKDREFSFKPNPSIDQAQSPSPTFKQKGSIADEKSTKVKLSFDDKNNPPVPQSYSSPQIESESQSNLDGGQSEYNHENVKLSKHAKMLRDKLNLTRPVTQFHKNDVDEEEKGDFMNEEFDQSRPITTRIHDNEDDQQLYIPYNNPQADTEHRAGRSNKHLSVEAGLEGKPKDDATLEDSDKYEEQ